MTRPASESVPALLALGAGLVQAKHRALTVQYSRPGDRYLFRWEYPGVLTVFCGLTGELLGRSKPGAPAEPEEARG